MLWGDSFSNCEMKIGVGVRHRGSGSIGLAAAGVLGQQTGWRHYVSDV
jgi:hypothetical protein